MSLFVPKEWKDRLAEFAGRRKLTNVSTGEETTVDVSRAEGEVSQAGDAFSAANMNDLEQRIKDGFDKVDKNLNGYLGTEITSNIKMTDNTPYTIDVDGWIYIWIGYGVSSGVFVYLNDIEIGRGYLVGGAANQQNQTSFIFPIKKGQILKMKYQGNKTNCGAIYSLLNKFV